MNLRHPRHVAPPRERFTVPPARAAVPMLCIRCGKHTEGSPSRGPAICRKCLRKLRLAARRGGQKA